jgi:hypothetical protein
MRGGILRIYFLSERDGRQVAGKLTVLLMRSEPGTGRVAK